MTLLVVGMNHKTAPVELRERLALAPEEIPRHLAAVARLPGVREAAILSTCNRVEVIAAGDEALDAGAIERFLAGLHRAPPDAVTESLYTHRDADAARHLFEVAASIDSLVVGEAEILGQVKAAYEQAQATGTAGRVLHASFQHALHAAKAIRTATRLCSRHVSVGSVAVEFAERIFRSLAGKRVLVIGAGEMAEATARALREAGADDLRIANRTPARAEELAARVGGRAVPFEQVERHLPESDIVLACAAAKAWLFGPEAFARALRERRYRPLVAIDIAVPRCIDPESGRMDHLYLFNIDDLASVTKANLAARREEIARCAPFLDAEVRAWTRQVRAADLGPMIARLREAYRDLGRRELELALAALPPGSDGPRAALEASIRRLVARFVHDQTVLVKALAENGPEADAMKAVERMLGEAREEMEKETTA